MKLDKQVGLYSIDTTFFYTEEEGRLHNEINELNRYKQQVVKPALTAKRLELEQSGYNAESIKALIEDRKKARVALQATRTILKEYKRNKWHKPSNEHYQEYLSLQKEIEEKGMIYDYYKAAIEEAKESTLKNTQEQKDMDFINECIKETKQQLVDEIESNVDIERTMGKMPQMRDKIANFDNSLLRIIGAQPNTFTEDIFTIRVYYYGILESLVKNGFTFRNEKYVFWSASAGQIRTKKCVFIKKTVLDKYYNTIYCGLTLDRINAPRIKYKDGKEIIEQGCNKNKYLAYTSLVATGSEKWEGFDIDQCIVVEDFETIVHGLVDYIDYNSYDRNNLWQITRKEMDIKIPTMDGCGISLDYTGMFRAPWCKGLFCEVPFTKFIRQKRKELGDNTIGIVKDIYGKEHDILKEGIRHIMTKSQFKMY